MKHSPNARRSRKSPHSVGDIIYSAERKRHDPRGSRHPHRGRRLMYGALWRVLPGPWWVRALILMVAAAAVLYGLIFYGFPWVSQFVNPQEVTVQ